ncbi:hypothetical protein BT96DRAFT_706265 [Gymnopus androsaceus JB14]|uniref:Uncharacterized protein n=1 Tax=Gymnopus androsaceus JB14 TaxID=1447944 RepID=A0A6A4GEQ7_9AGAR|nr:hypothetical protein BT96DRAFT_706265 [Gymnopus androsaceus JB14]
MEGRIRYWHFSFSVNRKDEPASPRLALFQDAPVPAPTSQHQPLNALGPSPSTIVPPTYALHTTQPLPSHSFVAPFPFVITPSSECLKDPLNGYAVLGMLKPKVYLMGPPLYIRLDAKGIGGMGVGGNEESGEEGEEAKATGKGKEDGRWAQSGYWPNAVFRPLIQRKRRESMERRRGERPGERVGIGLVKMKHWRLRVNQTEAHKWTRIQIQIPKR